MQNNNRREQIQARINARNNNIIEEIPEIQQIGAVIQQQAQQIQQNNIIPYNQNQRRRNQFNANDQSALKILYNKIVNGNVNMKDLINTVKDICNLVPELDINSSQGIHNYSQKQLEQIVIKFIKKVQNIQINDGGIKKEQADYDDELSIKKQRWFEKIKPYYDAHKNNIKDLPQILNINSNHNTTYQKIYDSLDALGFLTDFIYDSSMHQFQYLHWPSASYLKPKKLTLNLFTKLVTIRSEPDLSLLNYKEKLQNKKIQQIYEVFESQIQPPFKRLHINVKETTEFKFVQYLLKSIEINHKKNKFSRQMNKSINRKNTPNINDATNKIFKKFKQFKTLSNTKTINKESDYMLKNDKIDVFRRLKENNLNVKVLGTDMQNQQKLREKNQKKQSNSLLKQLKLIPEGQNVDGSDDIYKTSGKFKNQQKIINDIHTAMKSFMSNKPGV